MENNQNLEAIKELAAVIEDLEQVMTYVLNVHKVKWRKEGQGYETWNQIQEVAALFRDRKSPEYVKGRVDNIVKSLEKIYMDPKVEDNVFTFVGGEQRVKLELELNFLLYLSVYENEECIHYAFMGTPAQFSLAMRIVEKFLDMTKLVPEKHQPLLTFHAKLCTVADKFVPQWRELHKKALNTFDSKLDQPFFTKNDVEELTKVFQNGFLGKEAAEYLQNNDYKAFWKLMFENPETGKSMEDFLSGDILKNMGTTTDEINQSVQRSATSHPGAFTGFFSTFTLSTKLKKISETLNRLGAILDNTPAQAQSSYQLLIEATRKAEIVQTRILLGKADRKEKDQYLAYLKEQNDQFFTDRAKYFFALFQFDIFPMDEAFMFKVYPLVLSDFSLYVYEHNVSEEEVASIKAKVPDILKDTYEKVRNGDPTVSPSTRQPTDEEKQIGEEIVRALFDKHGDQIMAVHRDPTKEHMDNLANLLSQEVLADFVKRGYIRGHTPE